MIIRTMSSNGDGTATLVSEVEVKDEVQTEAIVASQTKVWKVTVDDDGVAKAEQVK